MPIQMESAEIERTGDRIKVSASITMMGSDLKKLNLGDNDTLKLIAELTFDDIGSTDAGRKLGKAAVIEFLQAIIEAGVKGTVKAFVGN